MLGIVNLETRVPADHPLRPVKQLVDQTLAELDPVFERMYAGGGRSSIPPERLLKALLLMALFSIRSERLFCEQLAYNMLFLWFLDMQLSEQPFDATTFTKNRQRFEEHDVLRRFFEVTLPRTTGPTAKRQQESIMPAKSGSTSRRRRRYTSEFRAEAVRLVTDGGLTQAQAARDLGISAKLLSSWVRVASERSLPGAMGALVNHLPSPFPRRSPSWSVQGSWSTSAGCLSPSNPS